ncbi:uncharacterized protein LOC134830150 [Culicoides brevitarsis]|uniref:uncharacterized protein LOC134830150 n=1 Tax=Culicoides brevitarsis TaxID=469753 RepID=UPI00307C4889
MTKNQKKIIFSTIFLAFLANFVQGALIVVKNNVIENEVLPEADVLPIVESLPIYTLNCFSEESGFCVAQEIKLNETHRHFRPASTIPADMVKIISLGGHPPMKSQYRRPSSEMHTLTSDLCQAFPNLKIIDAKYLNLQNIEEDALRDCVNLEAINLAANNLQEINVNLFKNNKNLEKIRMEDNSFTKIDLSLFEELRHLNELGFDGQLLDEFQVNKVRHRGIIKLVLRFSERSAIESTEVGILQKYQHLSSFIPCYRDNSYDIYVHHLDSQFMRLAKLFCFVRPGNDDKEIQTPSPEEEKTEKVIVEVISQNTIEENTE